LGNHTEILKKRENAQENYPAVIKFQTLAT